LEPYINAHTKIEFSCEFGHHRHVVPYSIIQGTSKCPVCNGKQRKTTTSFLLELSDHNKEYPSKQLHLIEGEQYVNGKTKLRFYCNNGHKRVLAPELILSQHIGCAQCSNKIKRTITNINAQLRDQHTSQTRPLIQAVPNQEYINNSTPILFKCALLHVWSASAGTVLYSSGCPRCVKQGFSRKAINWLTGIEHTNLIHIQHADNGGEYVIPHPTIKNLRVDGFCESTNTVYQFHGDAFHGNLSKFKPQDNCHPFDSTKTALSLYTDTIRKEQAIIDCGFTLIVMWEQDYDLMIS